MSSRAVQTSVSSVTMGNEDENQQDEIKHEPGKLTELEQRLRVSLFSDMQNRFFKCNE